MLFAIVMDALTDYLNKDMREFPYAHDLAILGNSCEDVSQKYGLSKKKINDAQKQVETMLQKSGQPQLTGKKTLPSRQNREEED